MSVLVTGIDTILGYHVAVTLESSGFTVRALAPGDPGVVIPEEGSWQACFGLTTDIEACLGALDGVSAVFHCEAGNLAGAGPMSMQSFVEGTRNVLVAMSRAGVEDLVYVGSALTLQPGDVDSPGDESAAWDKAPALTCLEALRASGDLVSRYNDAGKVRAVTLCPTLVMGTHDLPGGAGWRIIDSVASGERHKDGGSVNVVRASDAAAAAVRSLGRGRPGEAYILGGNNITTADLFDGIASTLTPSSGEGGAPPSSRPFRRVLKRVVPRIKAPESDLFKLLGTELCYDPSKAVAELGMDVSPPSDTIREAAEWYRSRSD